MRDARTVMAELAATGLTPDQCALVMELSAAVASEARPVVDRAAENKRAYDRSYRRKSRTKSYDTGDEPPYEVSSTPQAVVTEASASSTTAVAARKPDPFPKPDWAEPQVWADFRANRKRRKMTDSVTAYRQFLGDVERIADDEWPPGRLLEYAAGKGWGSINDPRENGNGRHANNRGQPQRMGGPRPDPTLAIVRTAIAAQRRDAGDHGDARAALPAGQLGRP